METPPIHGAFVRLPDMGLQGLEALHEIFKCGTTRKTQEKSLGWSGRVFSAAVIPKSRRKGAKDPFKGDRLPIGIF